MKLTIEKYVIKKDFIPNLPKIAFRKGKGMYEGVCMHATAVYNDSPEGQRNYETTHWQSAFVHSFTDEDTILQVADWDYISYGCGQTGNKFLLNFELCQDRDHILFLAAYDRWVWQAAYALYKRKLGVINGKTLWSHKQISDTYKESTHQDPIAYLASHGKTWDDVVRDVTNYYNTFKEEEEMKEEVLALQAQVKELTKQVETLKAASSLSVPPSWAKDAVDELVKMKVVDTPNGGSNDFYRIVTILKRLGIFKKA